MVIVSQTPAIEVEDALDRGQIALDFLHLVHLLLIRRDHEARTAMVQHIGHLFGHRVLVKRHRDRTAHLRGQH